MKPPKISKNKILHHPRNDLVDFAEISTYPKEHKGQKKEVSHAG